MVRDERVFVLGEDVGVRGGVFLATDGFIEQFGEERVIDTPIAESSIAGMALGAAMNGMRPIAEIQFADFIWPVFNQIVGEAARARYGSNGKLSVPLVLRAPEGGGVRGALYHSQSAEAYFCHAPGLKVITPSTPYDAKGLLKSAIRDDNPVVFLEHKRTYRLVRGEVPDVEYTIPIGKADVKREGDDVSVFTYGLMVHHCLEAAQTLQGEGISVEVVDLRTLAPFGYGSRAGVGDENGQGAGGTRGQQGRRHRWRSRRHNCRGRLRVPRRPVRRLAGPEVPAMPFSPPLEALYMLDSDKIANAIRNLAAY